MKEQEKKIKQVDIECDLYEDLFYEGKGKEFMKQYFTGYAFVSFDTEKGMFNNN